MMIKQRSLIDTRDIIPEIAYVNTDKVGKEE